MESNDERIYVSLDLKSPILNVKMPNNTLWYDLKNLPIHNDFILKKIKNFLLIFNQQVPWNESLTVDDVLQFLQNDNDINVLLQENHFIGWAWQNKKVADNIKLKKGEIYQSRWLIDKKFLFKKINKGLSIAWIQELKTYYRNNGFNKGLAYIDSWNKGVLRSVLRAGYKINDWT